MRITPILVAAMAAAPLGAQTPRLTLAEVYQRLDIHSPLVAVATARADAAQARVGPAGRWPDPSVQFQLMNRSLPSFELDPTLGMNQVQLMQMVPIAGRPGLARRAATASAEAERAEARETGLEVRAQGAMNFYDLYVAERSLAVMADSRRLLGDAIRAAEAMYAEGRGSQADVLRAQVELARMDAGIIDMQAMRDRVRGRLAALLVLPPDSVREPVLPLMPASLPTRDSLVQLALGQRPRLTAGRLRIEAADAAARRADREIWPDLTLGVAYGQRPMGGETDRMMSFMFGFTLPITARSNQKQMAAEARAMAAMASADLTEMGLATRARVGELHADLVRSQRVTQLYRTTLLPQAEAAAASALAGYQSGLSSFMTLLEGRMEILRVRTDLIRTEADAGRAIAELEMLTATSLLDAASAVPDAGGQS
jgi:cobalt-zinc-cadmium efflux system outer membrane protein